MSGPDADGRRALRAMRRARDWPTHTCPASRITAEIAEALIKGQLHPMLAEDPQHCGASMAHAVAALWQARADAARLRAAVERACARYPLDQALAPTCVTVLREALCANGAGERRAEGPSA